MGETTGISWCDHTFNAWWGCTKVSTGCKNCYAETFAKRYGQDIWGPGKPRRTFGPKHWAEPLKWNAAAERDGVRRRVFCGSMMDWADPEAPAGELERVWSLVRLTPWLDWLMLAKRPERIAELLPDDWGAGYPNVWLGTSVEDQEQADKRIPELLRNRAVVHFLSVEPLLGAVVIETWLHDSVCVAEGDSLAPLGVCICEDPREECVSWVIVGGESGSGRRPFALEWARYLREQCEDADGVAFWFKQIGAHRPGQGEDALGRVYHELPAVRR